MTYTTNSLGLREGEIPTNKPQNEYRVLLLGDSAIFGMGVEDDECVPRVIERLANKHQVCDRVYRVINMGVPSYNTAKQASN